MGFVVCQSDILAAFENIEYMSVMDAYRHAVLREMLCGSVLFVELSIRCASLCEEQTQLSIRIWRLSSAVLWSICACLGDAKCLHLDCLCLHFEVAKLFLFMFVVCLVGCCAWEVKGWRYIDCINFLLVASTL